MPLTPDAAGAPTRDPPHTGTWSRLERESLALPVVDLARRLVGLILVRDSAEGSCAGRIVETEVYGGPEDRASHARAGRTARNGAMFGPSGRAYVYLVYGLHHCLNVVAGPEGVASAVLIRALEPIKGIELMRLRRGGADAPDARLAAGPARLCQALAVDRRLDGADLVSGTRLWLAQDESTPRAAGAGGLLTGPRVGVAYAGPGWADRIWRFGLRGSPAISRPFPTEP